jgi:hypothetical protein
MAHTDGPRYAPRVATLSLGSSGVMNFFRSVKDTKEPHGFNIHLSFSSKRVYSRFWAELTFWNVFIKMPYDTEILQT